MINKYTVYSFNGRWCVLTLDNLEQSLNVPLMAKLTCSFINYSFFVGTVQHPRNWEKLHQLEKKATKLADAGTMGLQTSKLIILLNIKTELLND